MAGQPTLYRPEYCQMLLDHMSEGLSYEVFSAKIGVCRDTLYEWEKVHPEFSDTKKRAMEISQLFWEKIGIEGLFSTFQGSNLTPALWIFNMKARFRWKDQDPKDLPTLPEKQVLTLEEKIKYLPQLEQAAAQLKAEIEQSKVNE